MSGCQNNYLDVCPPKKLKRSIYSFHCFVCTPELQVRLTTFLLQEEEQITEGLQLDQILKTIATKKKPTHKKEGKEGQKS